MSLKCYKNKWRIASLYATKNKELLNDIYTENKYYFSLNHLLAFGVGGNGRTLSGGHLLVTKTVAGNGIDVPFNPDFPYGAGNCLLLKEAKKETNYKKLF